MARETSINAYNHIKENNLLGKLQFKVYQTLYYHGPLTGNEMRIVLDHDGNSGVYTTRLSELERMGAIKALEKRVCSATGHKALEWDVTSHIPKSKVKAITKKQKINTIAQGIQDFKQMINDSSYTIKREWLTRQLNNLLSKIKEI